MIQLLQEDEYLARLKAAGFVMSEIADEYTGLRVWIYNGEPCTPPGPHEDVKGRKYCPVALKIFMRRMAGQVESSDTKQSGGIRYILAEQAGDK